MKAPLSVVILTYNEENNIKDCIDSVYGFAEEIFVVDSGSTDKTLDLLSRYEEVKIINHPFENYSQQRNWAINNLPFSTQWILNMDADHRLTPEFRKDILQHFERGVDKEINGFLTSRKTLFMGKWIKYGGHYPTYHAVLFRKGYGLCEDKLYDQHFKVEGKTIKIKGDIVDLITESLSTFTLRHDKWSTLEAWQQYAVEKDQDGVIKGTLDLKNPIAQRRYLKNIYEKFPLFVRPFIYFFIRYFLRLGFLDGRRGLIFHFLQCFWFRFLIDAKIYELKQQNKK